MLSDVRESVHHIIRGTHKHVAVGMFTLCQWAARLLDRVIEGVFNRVVGGCGGGIAASQSALRHFCEVSNKLVGLSDFPAAVVVFTFEHRGSFASVEDDIAAFSAQAGVVVKELYGAQAEVRPISLLNKRASVD